MIIPNVDKGSCMALARDTFINEFKNFDINTKRTLIYV